MMRTKRRKTIKKRHGSSLLGRIGHITSLSPACRYSPGYTSTLVNPGMQINVRKYGSTTRAQTSPTCQIQRESKVVRTARTTRELTVIISFHSASYMGNEWDGTVHF